ncbi:sigma-70 family RNA polymerase sigma factor [Pseudobacteroides cellulosolvens]|uniref:Sigma-70 region 4 type 2 n=1 Tax=Pseudobacteroides cellulosolvens ATCC 35603 = DSM 2933 TaxID=398512 RepID=A0A0L6JHW4_9FIRM|nr:sigma-70 family RNA polymerase sigma factor [Pseudobacteroides cellulosolvens]KNY25314.1 Sigma-70 region 4 type 2 [Pseudobacteroides cellulosolvens ATCC 35603 = DSM 2933]
MQLKTIIFYAQKRKGNYLEEVISKFRFLVKKYARLLNYEDAESDLILHLIELIDKMPALRQDNAYVSYIHKSIVNKYLYLKKRIYKNKLYEIPLEDIDYLLNEEKSMMDLFICTDYVNKLPQKQKNIIYKLFFQQYSEIEIAKQLQISKQAVNKTKKKALCNLKEVLGA